VSSGDVTAPFQLVEAHRDQLRESYTVGEEYAIRFENGTLYQSELSTTEVATTASRYRHQTAVMGTAPNFLGGVDGTLTIFSNGTVAVRKLTVGENNTYRIYTDASGTPIDPATVAHGTPTNDDRISTLFSYAESVKVERHNASTYTVEATVFTTESLIVGGTTIQNVSVDSFTATITADGLVQRYELELSGTLAGQPVSVTERVEYTAVGSTTVEPPAWVETALNATSRN